MSRDDLSEDQAKIVFAQQIEGLARGGADPDCERRLADIIAENEAACLAMERQATDLEGPLPRATRGECRRTI